MSEEVRQLAEILAHTFNPDVTKRAPAEEHLKKIEESAPNYHSCLLQLVTINEIPLDIRQAAVLRLKNLCNEFWSITTGEGVRISETDRKVIKENILEAIIFQPAPVIRVQLLEVFYVAVKFDWPDSWESVLPAIMRNIKSDDRARVFGALQALQMIFRVYQYKGKDKRGPVADLVTLTFPVMLAIVTHVSTLEPSLEGFEIIQVVARIFYLATQLSIPPHLDNAATLQPWMSFWLGLLELPLPESMNPKDPAHIYRNPLWRAKKWTCQTINRLFSVWGRPQSVSKEGQKFARLFFDRFAKPCLAAYLKLLLQKKEQNNVPPRVVQLAYVYLTHTVTLTALYKPLKPHIRFLLLESVLPTMCLSPADLTTWKEDPHEFVKRDLDIMEQFHDPRVAATNLLVSLVKYRTRDSLELTLSACTSILQAYAEEPDVSKKNYLLKEGALRMIGCLRKLLLNTESLAASVEPLLITHVFPEFANPIGFMRARACAVVGQFNKLEWASEAHHAQAVQHVTLALRDTELPVKLEAAIAISRLVNEGKIVQFIRPHLQMILDQFFVLMDEIGNEEVVTTLANLIDMFDKEIIPYALVMTKRLAHMFTELLKAPAADDESALTAQQCLVAINTILYAVDSVPEIYESIEAILAPVLDVLVNERCMEFFDDTLECIGCLAYFPKKISDFSWSLLPRILGAFFTWAPDYISNMLPIIDNYISIDPKRFVETKEPNYLVGVMKICVALLEDPKREADCPFAPKIIECILAHCRGMVDPLIPDIIKMLTQKLITASDPLLRLLVCDAIGAVSYYNPVLFLQICKAVGDEFTQELFNRWLSHLPAMRKSTRHEKMAVLGLSSLCLTPLGAAPRPLQTAFADVLAEIIRVLSVFKEDEAKEIAAEEARKEAEEEEDEEKSENTLKDLGEEEDAPEEQVDMEKFTSEIAEAMRMRQLATAAGMQDEAEDYTSPIDNVDPFIFFATCLQVLSTREKPFYDHWAASLPAELGVLVQAHIAEAGERQKQLREAEEKEKAEKEAGGTAAEAD